MKKPFLSVVIPLFNKENFVLATIESVLCQTFIDFEIIVVEDCSTDLSKKIVENIISDKIRIVQHNKNKGLSASRNTGIRESFAEFVVFLDADDLMKSNYLEKIVSLIQKFPKANLFATNYEKVYKKNNPAKNNLEEINNYKEEKIVDFFAQNLQEPIYCQSSLCVRKSAFLSFGMYNENIDYSEDVDFNIRANINSKLAYSYQKLVQYTMYDDNRITNKNIIGKKIPDFDTLEKLKQNDTNFKKHLDINRYMLASVFKKSGDLKTFNKLKNGINSNPKISGLNLKQQILLQMPSFCLNIISKIKLLIQKKGIKFSSFD